MSTNRQGRQPEWCYRTGSAARSRWSPVYIRQAAIQPGSSWLACDELVRCVRDRSPRCPGDRSGA